MRTWAAGVGGGRARRPIRDARRWVLAGGDHGARLPTGRHLREGGRVRTEPRIAGLPPARGRGVGSFAAGIALAPTARVSTTTATGSRLWPLTPSMVVLRPTPGIRANLEAAVGALGVLHEMLTPNPVPRACGRRPTASSPSSAAGPTSRRGPGPPGLDEWAAATATVSPSSIRVAGRRGGIDAAPLRRALRHLPRSTRRRRGRFRRLARCLPARPVLNLVAWAPSVEWREAPLPKNSWPCTVPPLTTAVWSPAGRRVQRVPRVQHSLRPPRRGCPRCDHSRPRRVRWRWPGCGG